jgi:hypothetical protein
MFQWAKAHFFVEIDAAEGQRSMIAGCEVRRDRGASRRLLECVLGQEKDGPSSIAGLASVRMVQILARRRAPSGSQ